MFARLLLASMLVFSDSAMAQSPPSEVVVKRVDANGEPGFEVTASGAVKAAPEAVWKVLTDYEAMPGFVPDLETTKVLSRTGNRVIIEQSGVARLLFLSRSIRLVVQALEEPMKSIDISLVNGDMKLYNCRWQITALPDGGTRIDYSGKMVPKFYVPGMLGSNIIRRDIDRMMSAVLEHLDRPD
jgi:ribosome-associated toxin RatA of RatAB toxin-antitoxin module